MRVHYVKSARKSKKARTCRCGHVVQPGEGYKWAEPRFGPIKIWCHEHSPRRSELTTSKLATLYDAQDDFTTEGVETIEDLQASLESLAEVAREVAEEYQDSIDNMPDALQESSPAAEQMREYIYDLEQYADDLESFSPDEQEDEESDEDFVSRIQEEASSAAAECSL